MVGYTALSTGELRDGRVTVIHQGSARPLPDARRRCPARSRERYEEFVEAIGRLLAKRGTLAKDVSEETTPVIVVMFDQGNRAMLCLCRSFPMMISKS